MVLGRAPGDPSTQDEASRRAKPDVGVESVGDSEPQGETRCPSYWSVLGETRSLRGCFMLEQHIDITMILHISICYSRVLSKICELLQKDLQYQPCTDF